MTGKRTGASQTKRSPVSPRSAALAKIHIGAAALGMIRTGDDEAYRIMLHQVAGVRSAKDLDGTGIHKVLAHLRACGWKDLSHRPASGAGGHVPALGAGRYQKGTPAALIRWLWTQLARAGLVDDESDHALRRYIGQHAGLSTRADERDPRHLTGREASMVIEQLKRWQARGGHPA